MARKKKEQLEAQTKIYEKYQELMRKARKYKIEGAIFDGLKYECMAEAYFEGASDMLHDLYPEKSLSKDKWTISL